MTRCHPSHKTYRVHAAGRVATAIYAQGTHTSLSKSWSGSDMLLRGTGAPGSDPPIDKDTFDLRERPRGSWKMELLPQHLSLPGT